MILDPNYGPVDALGSALYETLQDWRFMTTDDTLVKVIIEELRERGYEIVPVTP